MMQVGVGFTVSDSGTFRIPGRARQAVEHRSLEPTSTIPGDDDDEWAPSPRRKEVIAATIRTILTQPILHLRELAPMSQVSRLAACAALQRVCLARLATI